MPISSGAGKWTRAARNNKTNLKRSPDWPDVGRSSTSLASSNPAVERHVKRTTTTTTTRLIKGGSSTTGPVSSQHQQGPSQGKQSAASVGGRPAHGHSTDQEQQQISIDERAGGRTIESGEEAPPASRPRKIMNSLGGQRVITGASSSTSAIDKTNAPLTMSSEQSGGKQTNLISTLVLSGGGAGRVDTNPTANDDYKKPRLLAGAGGKTYSLGAHKSALNYHLAGQQHQLQQAPGKASLQGSQASLLNNPSMSFQANAAGSAATSASSSLANLHNLHNQQGHSSRGAPLNISKRLNLKYVKSLIVLLMSLDLLITVFVYHFSSHDELSIAFTSHKLRFSLLNLILSSIWFVVLSGAIIFDIYPILLLGCLVDFASFLLLLVCSFIHFTHRIDYNTVNLTSLLLLLFSIIVLHVYLLVIAALTTYLMLAVKRRRKIQS